MFLSIAWDQIADLYDTYVHADFDIPFFVDEARAVKGEVLELMCGTGRVTLPLLQAGAKLTCVDNSSEMLTLLRRKLDAQHLAADVRQIDVRELMLDKQFDLILIPFHSLGELVSADDRRATLKRIHAQLTDRGRLIVTLHNPPLRLKSIDDHLHLVGKHLLPERESLFFWTWQSYDPDRRIVTGYQFYELYDARGIMQRKRMLEIRFALLGPDEFADLARSEGFQVQSLYGDYRRSPFDPTASPYQIWILTK
ncbi:MAG: methyltransferase domain-containing protein [Anaerolineae bacterium]